MSDTTSASISLDGRHVLYMTVSIILQSLFYGIYALLVPFALYMLRKRGLSSRAQLLLFAATIVPFILCSLYWAVEVAEQAVRIETFFINRDKRNLPNVTTYNSLFNAIVLLNYIVSDAVVVWRGWILCRDDYTKTVYSSLIFLLFTTVTIFATIAVRISLFFLSSTSSISHSLTDAINVLQESTLVLSFVTNITATAVISHKAWRHRVIIKKGLRDTPNKTAGVERILALLVESGLIYSISGVIAMTTGLLRLPFGTVGDVYWPVNTQIAGIYPTLVVVLVGMERTVNDTTHWQSTAGRGTIISNDHIASNASAQDHISHIRFTRDPDAYHRTREPVTKDKKELAA